MEKSFINIELNKMLTYIYFDLTQNFNNHIKYYGDVIRSSIYAKRKCSLYLCILKNPYLDKL